MTIHLIRHTRVQVPAGLCYGRTEVPLAGSFEEDASRVKASLPTRYGRVFSSPALRCRRLAESLTPDYVVDARLAELNFGAWDGRLWSELPRSSTEVWLADYENRRPPGGETYGELAARVASFRDHLSQTSELLPYLVITHAGVIRAWLAAVKGMDLGDAQQLPAPFGSVHQV